MSGSTPNGNYRDELVAIIKDIGQELIDRAEEMVAEDATFIKDFYIDIDIPNPREEEPTITWRHSTLCTNYINRMDPSRGLKSRCMTPKRARWVRVYDPISGGDTAKCSACDKWSGTSYDRAPKTCPGCNAYMRTN